MGRATRSGPAANRDYQARVVEEGATRGASAQVATQNLGEHGGVAVIGVTRGEDQREDARPRTAAQVGQPLAVGAELGALASAELLEALRLVSVPAPQRIAGRQLACPVIDRSTLARDPARPHAIDEDPVAVTR